MYMDQAFGPPAEDYPEPGETLQSVLRYVAAAHQRMIECLQSLDDEALVRPVKTTAHGESAANLFWVLVQHDVSHGGQIGVLRAAIEEQGS